MTGALTIACIDGRPCAVHSTARVIAAAEASGRAAERERCAGMVREMAAKLDEAALRRDRALDKARGDADGAFLRGRAMGYEFAAMWTRGLAERIAKGEP